MNTWADYTPVLVRMVLLVAAFVFAAELIAGLVGHATDDGGSTDD